MNLHFLMNLICDVTSFSVMYKYNHFYVHSQKYISQSTGVLKSLYIGMTTVTWHHNAIFTNRCFSLIMI